MAQQDGEEDGEMEQQEPEIVGEEMEMEDEGEMDEDDEQQYDQPINIDGQGE
jgi:hypothetical protein